MTESDYQVLEISDSESDIIPLQPGSPNAHDTASVNSPGGSSLVYDLTEEEYKFIHDLDGDDNNNDGSTRNSSNQSAAAGSSSDNSVSIDDDTYAFFVEAGLEDPEDLKALGIDIDEIKEQKRREMEKQKSLEYAMQLQQQYNASQQANATQPTSAAEGSSSNAQLHPIFTQLPAQLAAAQQQANQPAALASQPSFMSQSSIKREINAIDDQQQQQNKKAKMDLADKGKNAIELPDDDDDDCIDLTDDNVYYRDHPQMIYDDEDEGLLYSDEEMEVLGEDYLSHVAWNTGSYKFPPKKGTGAWSGIEDNGLNFPIMAGIPRPYTHIPMPVMAEALARKSGSHMDEIARQNQLNPFQRAPQVSMEEAERELRELLENAVYDEPPPPEDRTGTPEGLSINLLEHQKIGLQWMLKMERSNNKGGILADDMGLGKTIQALATIVDNPCDNATQFDESYLDSRRTTVSHDELRIKATLIVCPVSLMDQWRREIETKTEPRLKVLVFHGNKRISNPYQLAAYDVIISSYAVTASNYRENFKGPFSHVIFHRVVLDEAHTIKNKQTISARGCCQIEATYRWCMTATPIQNRVDELYSLIKFLRIRPFCEWDEFRDTILKPLKDGNHKKGIQVAAVLMKAISLRRSKKAIIDGKPILNLPERNIHMTHIDFSPDERIHYDYVNQRAQARFNKFLQQGVVMKNYSSVLVLLLRLRQACLHPSLTLVEGEEANKEGEEESARQMNPEVIGRLLSDSATLTDIECPICMDIAQDAQILKNCGHILCKECLDSYINTNDGSLKRCPQCRGELSVKNLVGVETFIKVHAPHLMKEADQEVEEEAQKEKEALERVQDFVITAKIQKMLDILEETATETNNQDKTIVFSQFTGFLDLVGRPLKDKGYKFLRYDGSMDIKQRADTVSQFFDDPEVKVLLVSTKCGSLGLNLTCANRVILMDVWWNPALENQAIDRVHRIGQLKPVEVHRIFIKDTVEDRILALQEKKQQIADGVLGEGSQNNTNRLGVRELLYLFRGGELPENNAGEGSSSNA